MSYGRDTACTRQILLCINHGLFLWGDVKGLKEERIEKLLGLVYYGMPSVPKGDIFFSTTLVFLYNYYRRYYTFH